MRLDVSKALAAEGEEIPFAGTLDLPGTEVLGEAVTFPVPAELTGSYASVGETVHLRGNMAFTAASRCSLCLKPVKEAFHTSFDAVFSLSKDPGNPDLYAYDGAWIDPAAMAEDAAQLALPMRWLCARDCQGLCPHCGADRNTTSCTCRMEAETKHPFSALQQLLTEDESEV